MQAIKFRLDEKGASLISTAFLGTDFGIEIEEGKTVLGKDGEVRELEFNELMNNDKSK